MTRLTATLSTVAVIALALTLVPLRQGLPHEDVEPRNIRIALIDHGYHVGLVLPAREHGYNIASEFGLEGGGDLVEIGWGDKAFYMNHGFEFGMALSALFWGSQGSVMHVWLRGRDSLNDIVIDITHSELQRIVEYVRSTAQRDSAGAPTILALGYYGKSSAFIDAHSTYSLAYTCNQWTSDVLLQAGISMPLVCPLPKTVLWPAQWQRSKTKKAP